jgi:signal transduction histidine kinase
VLLNTKLFTTSTFRLAALYFIVFLVSVLGILTYVFWNTVGLIERQTDETIRAEVQGISDQYRLRGLRGVIDVIQRRNSGDSATIYLVVNPKRERLVGNLEELPANATGDPGWIDFPLIVKRGESSVRHTGRAYHTGLSGGYHVLVGRDVEEQRQFRDLIFRTLYVALPLALLLGLGGGLLTSRNFLRRVDDIAGTSRSIMLGDLSRRMPMKGSGDELDRLSTALNDMLDQIERLMAGMKEVTSNVAHDLKTPLTRLRARVDAALRSGNAREYKAALTQTIDESDRLLQTFNALMSIARAEAGQAREGLQRSDLHGVLEDVCELYEPLVEEAGGKLTCSSLPGLWARTDRQLISQAISNLIDNAIKYGGSADGAVIKIAGRSTGNEIEISVSDHGDGIPASDRERVKDRFTRLDESRTKPGNGLGLALVSSVMKLHGGQLVLEDNAPGLKAKLVLPLLGEGGS